MQFRPKLVDGLFYAEKAGKHLSLNPAVPDWIVVNANGGLLLSKCDGKSSVEESAASWNARFSDIKLLFGQQRNARLSLALWRPRRN